MKPRFSRTAGWLALLAHSLAAAQGSPAADASPGATPSGFVRLIPLPNPIIVGSAEPYPGGGNNATNLLDGVSRTEYASHAKGTNTFVEFDFGRPTLIAGLRHVDRNDPAMTVTSELVFMDASGRVLAATPVPACQPAFGCHVRRVARARDRPTRPVARHRTRS